MSRGGQNDGDRALKLYHCSLRNSNCVGLAELAALQEQAPSLHVSRLSPVSHSPTRSIRWTLRWARLAIASVGVAVGASSDDGNAERFIHT